MGGLLGAGEARERERGRDAERRVRGRHERRDEDERAHRVGHRRRAAGRRLLGLALDRDRRRVRLDVVAQRPAAADGGALTSSCVGTGAPPARRARNCSRATTMYAAAGGQPRERVDDRRHRVRELVALDAQREVLAVLDATRALGELARDDRRDRAVARLGEARRPVRRRRASPPATSRRRSPSTTTNMTCEPVDVDLAAGPGTRWRRPRRPAGSPGRATRGGRHCGASIR